MRRKRKSFWKPVTAGFGAVYLLTMALATFLVKTKFAEDFTQRFREFAVSLVKEVNEKERSMEESGWDSQEKRRDHYQYLANGLLWKVNDEMLQVSVGFYDKDMRLMAQTRDEIGGNSIYEAGSKVREYASFCLDDYISMQEKEQLARYQWKSVHSFDMDQPGKYRFSIRTSPDGQTLWAIYVQEIVWTRSELWDGENYKDPLTGSVNSMEMARVDYETGEETITGSFEQTDSCIVWQWVNPEVPIEELETGIITNTSMQLPYMTAYETWRDFESWKTWSGSQYLHRFSQQGEFAWEEGIEEPPVIIDSDGLNFRGRYQLKVGVLDGEAGPVYVEVRMESSPWLAALDYMKYVYLAGFVLTLVCGIKIVLVFRKTYDTQMALEDMRRDFTNAMAHELKTPLGVIRNFAENLAEHNMEEKREYYLAQIIGQTEEMDRLVVKMIEISKLDSEELVLKREKVSFSQLVREQLARFEPMTGERGIQVQLEEKVDFVVYGDREYLAGAVGNLFSNAVDHNIDGGRILVRVEKDRCVVENTGQPLEEDTIAHAFDMFFTGDKSRSKRDGHMGMGLFLARKVLGLHGLELMLENMEDGVRVVVKEGNGSIYESKGFNREPKF